MFLILIVFALWNFSCIALSAPQADLVDQTRDTASRASDKEPLSQVITRPITIITRNIFNVVGDAPSQSATGRARVFFAKNC